MAEKTRVELKEYFNTGDTPTEAQFADFIDSYWHKSDTLSTDWANVTGKPAAFTPTAHGHTWTEISGKPTFFSGAYADLTGKPSLFSGVYADLTGKPSLAAVAISGDYADLSNKPILAAATGAAVVFTSDKRYGTIASPITANITASYTGAVAGATICIVHASGTAPTFPADFKKMGTVAYDITKTNFIWCVFVGDGSRVEYIITQEA